MTPPPQAAFGSSFFAWAEAHVNVQRARAAAQPRQELAAIFCSRCCLWAVPRVPAWVAPPRAALLEGSAGLTVTPAGPGGHRQGAEDAPLSPRGWRGAAQRALSADGLTAALLPAGHGQTRHLWLHDGQGWHGQTPGGAGTCPGSQLCPAAQQVRSVPWHTRWSRLLRSLKRGTGPRDGVGGSKVNF